MIALAMNEEQTPKKRGGCRARAGRKSITDARIDKVWAMLQRGLSKAVIAQSIGLNLKTIKRIISQNRQATGGYVVCQECHNKVILPCRICAFRKVRGW